MTGQSTVVTLRAFGYDARSDGLGHVRAHLWQRHSDGTQTAQWVEVPTDPPGLLAWLAHVECG